MACCSTPHIPRPSRTTISTDDPIPSWGAYPPGWCPEIVPQRGILNGRVYGVLPVSRRLALLRRRYSALRLRLDHDFCGNSGTRRRRIILECIGSVWWALHLLSGRQCLSGRRRGRRVLAWDVFTWGKRQHHLPSLRTRHICEQ